MERSGHSPFTTYKRFMIDTYGAALHRVPIDLGLGCPHRKPDGTGGCTFCPPDGSRAGYTRTATSIEAQMRQGIEFARSRYGAKRFMLYIQAFTGTFACVTRQRELYHGLLDSFTFDAVSIGTRPDCLPDATLDLLVELRRRIDVWVELGVQTVHDATLKRVHRGHTWETSRGAILDLHRRGISAAVHVIVGLPGEDTVHFSATADTLAHLPIAGIKIHNLHVIRGTELGEEFLRLPFRTYDELEYAEILIDFIRRLPPTVPVMRINTDTAAEDLIAPCWKMKKGQFRALVEREMRRRGQLQGDLFTP